MGRFREALADFDKLTELDPNDQDAWFHAAAAYLSAGDVAQLPAAPAARCSIVLNGAPAEDATVAEKTAKTCAGAGRGAGFGARRAAGPAHRHGRRTEPLVPQLHPHQGADRLPRRAPRAGRRVAEAVRPGARRQSPGRHRLRRPGHGTSPARPSRAGTTALVSAHALLARKPDAQSWDLFDWLRCEILYREAEGLMGPVTPQAWPPRRPRSNCRNSPGPGKRSASGRTTASLTSDWLPPSPRRSNGIARRVSTQQH